MKIGLRMYNPAGESRTLAISIPIDVDTRDLELVTDDGTALEEPLLVTHVEMMILEDDEQEEDEDE